MTARSRLILAAAVAACSSYAIAQTTAPTTRPITPVPDEFRDAESGVRIVKMSRIPNDRAGVIYFTNGTTTDDSTRALFHVQFDGKRRHLYTFEFATGKVTPIVTDRITEAQDFSPRTHTVYYIADRAIWSTNVDTLATRKIAELPADWSVGAGLSVNADETLLCNACEVGTPEPASQPTTASTLPSETARLKSIGSTFEQKRPNLLYTVDLKTGEIKVVHRINTWLGHVQWSPTDPKLVMFCHEGPWGKVDRIWTYRVGDAEPTVAYKRAEEGEIAGHEIWSPDGSTIWFQNSIRSRRASFLAGVNLATGAITRYRQPESGGGIHQFQSPDGKYFVGDGGGKQATGPGKYLTVQVPEGDTLKVEKVVTLQENDYTQSEPNPHLTPDQKWVVFTASYGGNPPQAWAAEMPEKYWRK